MRQIHFQWGSDTVSEQTSSVSVNYILFQVYWNSDPNYQVQVWTIPAGRLMQVVPTATQVRCECQVETLSEFCCRSSLARDALNQPIIGGCVTQWYQGSRFWGDNERFHYISLKTINLCLRQQLFLGLALNDWRLNSPALLQFQQCNKIDGKYVAAFYFKKTNRNLTFW